MNEIGAERTHWFAIGIKQKEFIEITKTQNVRQIDHFKPRQIVNQISLMWQTRRDSELKYMILMQIKTRSKQKNLFKQEINECGHFLT